MKKIIITMALILAVTGLKAKTLIAYYSFTNNIHTIATELQLQTEADIIRIEPAEKGIDYAADGYAIGSALIAAIRENPDEASSYPTIDEVNVNLADYDMIVITAPLWWSNMAAPMQAFLFQYGAQMTGKNIALIVSSASSGISGVVDDAKRLVPNGKFIEPSLWIRSSQTGNCRSLIADWLKDIDYESLTSSVIPIAVNGSEKNGTLYNMSGVRVGQAARSGIYIMKLQSGNKKIIVKRQ